MTVHDENQLWAKRDTNLSLIFTIATKDNAII